MRHLAQHRGNNRREFTQYIMITVITAIVIYMAERFTRDIILGTSYGWKTWCAFFVIQMLAQIRLFIRFRHTLNDRNRR